MANTETIETKKTTDLAENTAVADSDLFLVGNAGTSSLRKLKWSNIIATIKNKLSKVASSGSYNDLSDKPGVVSTTADGLAPKRDGSTAKFLRGDGTWAVPPDNDTKPVNMTGATTSAAGAAGYAPAPTAGAANRYLRSDGTWSVPPDNNTTYGNMKGATASAAGGAGLVPAPAAGANGKYLRGDGTWQTPPDTDTKPVTMTGASSSAAGSAGYAPAPAAGAANRYLRSDGTWQVPPNDNTVYTHPSTHPASMITQDSTHRFATDAEKSTWNGKLSPTGDGSNLTAAFSQASSRANISTGEKLSVLFGKIAKWFADLKSHAFSDLVQNATSTSTTQAVSAAVAKNLQDQITQQNTNLILNDSPMSCKIAVKRFPQVWVDNGAIALTPQHIGLTSIFYAAGASIIVPNGCRIDGYYNNGTTVYLSCHNADGSAANGNIGEAIIIAIGQ